MIRIFTYPIQVCSQDIDIMQHTNNKVYLRWMEEAALAHSSALGWPYKKYFEIGAAFIARAHWIEYLRPTFLGDQLMLYTWVESMGEKRSIRRFYLMRGNKVCMKSATEWAFVDVTTGLSREVLPEVASSFPIVLPDDPELKTLGIRVNLLRPQPL